MRGSPSSASTSSARATKPFSIAWNSTKKSAMSLQEAAAEHPVGDLVERLRGHREQPRAVRHGEPAQQPAAEELDHPRRRVEHGQGVARRRRVDDDEVVLARRVEVVQLLHREVVVAVHEAAGDVLVQRVGRAPRRAPRRRARGGGSARPSRPWCRASPPTARRAASTPAAANAASGTRVAALPSAPTPSASASRRAGSTVSTSTLPPWSTAAASAERGGDRRLADAARAETSTISLLASSASSPDRRPSRCGAAHADVQLLGERLGDEGDDAPAGGLGEQLGHVQHGQAGREAGAQPLEVAGCRCAGGPR